MAQITVLDGAEAVAEHAAERIAQHIAAAVQRRGSAFVALTGGSTPRETYARLADPAGRWRDRVEWERVHLFWGDERHVAPDHEDSNYGMARDALIAKVPIPAVQVHRMRGELPAVEAAAEYERELASAFAAAGRTQESFDLLLLGLGEDAHIASLFPRTPALGERAHRATANWVPHLRAFRITLTRPAILDAAHVLMIVAGAAKADAVHAALEAPLALSQYPAQLLRDAGDRVEWILDEAAAARLVRHA